MAILKRVVGEKTEKKVEHKYVRLDKVEQLKKEGWSVSTAKHPDKKTQEMLELNKDLVLMEKKG